MQDQRYAILIPVYKNYCSLEWYERLAFERALAVFSQDTIILAAPDSLTIDYPFESHSAIEVSRFSNTFFDSIKGYNRLMLSPEFYSRFLNFKYILIYQLDAFVFSDRVQEFCDMGYDYLGAPWFYWDRFHDIGEETCEYSVGNGGFSLRNVHSCLGMLEQHERLAESWPLNEDEFFGYCAKKYPNEFRTGPFETAAEFAYESFVTDCMKITHFRLPFGCHGWMKTGRDQYLKMFHSVGIDLSGVQGKMHGDGRTIVKKINEVSANSFEFEKRIISKNRQRLPWCIWGSGKNGGQAAYCLYSAGEKIECFIDSDPSKAGCTHFGIPIVSPSMIAKLLHNCFFLIAPLNYSAIEEIMINGGAIKGIDFSILAEDVLPT